MPKPTRQERDKREAALKAELAAIQAELAAIQAEKQLEQEAEEAEERRMKTHFCEGLEWLLGFYPEHAAACKSTDARPEQESRTCGRCALLYLQSQVKVFAGGDPGYALEDIKISVEMLGGHLECQAYYDR